MVFEKFGSGVHFSLEFYVMLFLLFGEQIEDLFDAGTSFFLRIFRRSLSLLVSEHSFDFLLCLLFNFLLQSHLFLLQNDAFECYNVVVMAVGIDLLGGADD